MDQFSTPVAWVDLDVFENNVRELAEIFKAAGVSWRPHFKGLRVPALARKQIEAGAIGVTCATVSEAEAAADGGIDNLLIANEVIGDPDLVRVARLLRSGSTVITCVDDLAHISAISRIAQAEDVQWPVLIDIDVGMRRCGSEPGAPAVALCREAHGAPHVRLKGLMAYEGHTESIEDPTDRRAAIEDALELVRETVELARQAQLPIEIVSCGSSITYPVTAHHPIVTEIQAGGAAFMDIMYRNLGPDTTRGYALFVRGTIISRPAPDRAVANAGRKKMGCVFAVSADDPGEFSLLPCPVAMPAPLGLPGARVKTLNAEHAVLELDPSAEARVGDPIDFIPGYVDFTVYHYEQLVGVRADEVETVWKVEAR
jgi:D-serine deaminase-like pyridoxal phosphate-dependent protein